MDRRASAVALTVAVAVVVLLIASVVPRAPEPTASGASSTPATAATPRVLFARHVVLDTVPGGGAVVTDAYDGFEIQTAGRARQSHAVAGLTIGRPIFDGVGRVAYWRVAGMNRALEVTGGYELVVWDIQTDRDRVLLALSDERPSGSGLWSADRTSLVMPTRSVPATGRDSQARLLLIDADSGAARVLGANATEAAVAVVFADAQIVAGVRAGSFVVIDAASGAIRTRSAMRVVGTPMGEGTDLMSNADGMVVELLRRFEGEAGPLWVWNIRDAGRDVAKVDERGISDPVFWPGRTEVVFSGATGLMTLDYRPGQARRLLSPSDAHRVLAIEAGGRFALLQTGSGYQLSERIGDALNARSDLPVTMSSTLRPLGVLLP